MLSIFPPMIILTSLSGTLLTMPLMIVQISSGI